MIDKTADKPVDKPDSSLARLLAVLDLFDEQCSALTPEAIGEARQGFDLPLRRAGDRQFAPAIGDDAGHRLTRDPASRCRECLRTWPAASHP